MQQSTWGEHIQPLQKVNADLTRKNKEFQRFNQTLAHELKSPLASAREFLEIVLEEIPGSLTQKQREYLNIITSCHNAMTRQINDLFDITRLETGKLQVVPQPESLDQLTRQILTSFGPAAQKKGLTLHYSPGLNLPEVCMDKHRIRQVLCNLVENAIKYAATGGEILIQVVDSYCDEDRVQICVTDNGVGMAPHELQRIFDPLYQVGENTLSSGTGVGLGLFIAQEIVKLHGSILDVESTLGEGSTFSFTLPIIPWYTTSTEFLV